MSTVVSETEAGIERSSIFIVGSRMDMVSDLKLAVGDSRMVTNAEPLIPPTSVISEK